jgi:hypothetical protein
LLKWNQMAEFVWVAVGWSVALGLVEAVFAGDRAAAVDASSDLVAALGGV